MLQHDHNERFCSPPFVELFVVQNIKKGDKFSQKNIKRIRPGNGISPIFYEKILGKKSPQSLFAGDPLTNKILKSLNIR